MDIPEDLVDWTSNTVRTTTKAEQEKATYLEATNREQELTIPHALFSSGLSSTAIRTYYILRWAAHGKLTVQLTLDKLASISQSSAETQRRAIRELEAMTFIKTIRKPHAVRTVRINTYTFLNRTSGNNDLVVRAPNEYFDSTLKISPPQFVLAMILYREAQRRLDIKITMPKLEKMTGSNRSSINKNLKTLQAHKLLFVERTRRNRGFFHENRYFLRASIDVKHVDRLKAAKQAKAARLTSSFTQQQLAAPISIQTEVPSPLHFEPLFEPLKGGSDLSEPEEVRTQKVRLEEMMKQVGGIQFHSL
jgi:DNA-binding MarR family transcriptional regulator